MELDPGVQATPSSRVLGITVVEGSDKVWRLETLGMGSEFGNSNFMPGLPQTPSTLLLILCVLSWGC